MRRKEYIMFSLLAIAILSLLMNFSYIATGQVKNKIISGYIILMDQKPVPVFGKEGEKIFTTTIYLPSANVQGSVTNCSFVFPPGVDKNADLNEDGRIDYVDLKLMVEAYGCSESKECWDQSLKVIDCYFHHSNIRFKDPTLDCYINRSDMDIIKKYYGQTNSDPFSADCEMDEKCRADVNKDGVIDIFDLTMVASLNGEYAQEFSNTEITYKDADIDGNGIVDIFDIVRVASSFGMEADQQKCDMVPLEHISGNLYRVNVKGRGLFHVGVSYLAVV